MKRGRATFGAYQWWCRPAVRRLLSRKITEICLRGWQSPRHTRLYRALDAAQRQGVRS